jgi:hypothetical protein
MYVLNFQPKIFNNISVGNDSLFLFVIHSDSTKYDRGDKDCIHKKVQLIETTRKKNYRKCAKAERIGMNIRAS